MPFIEFHKNPNYIQTTARELASPRALPPTCTFNTESKTWRIFKRVMSYLILPIALYNGLHYLAGKIIIPASFSNLTGIERPIVSLHGEMKYKRFTIEVDGAHIDAVLMGTEQTLNNGRWILFSNGNNALYESSLHSDSDLTHLMRACNANGLVFNYPGVACSTGGPNRDMMAKAYRAMLTFLEQQIEAKEIIGCGYSIGGGVQGDALRTHPLQPHIKYVFIKSKTFSYISSVATTLTHRILGALVRLLGWNIESVTSSRSLKAPEIILQSADVSGQQPIQRADQIIHDGIISPEDSLATALLKDPDCPKTNKVFLGDPFGHDMVVYLPQVVARHTEELLRSQ